MNQHSVHTVK